MNNDRMKNVKVVVLKRRQGGNYARMRKTFTIPNETAPVPGVWDDINHMFYPTIEGNCVPVVAPLLLERKKENE